MKKGSSRDQGQPLGGLAYLRQRLADAINTELASLPGDRDYGSTFHELVDRNVDSRFYMDAYVRMVELVSNPKNGLDDFRLKEMRLDVLGRGHWAFDIIGTLLANGEEITLEGIEFNGGD